MTTPSPRVDHAGAASSGRRRNRFPTAGDLLHALLESRIGRWVLPLGFLWLGWHVLVRTSHG
jgi:hypothetical protein